MDVEYALAIGHVAKPGIMIATITKGNLGRSTLDDTPGDIWTEGVSIWGGTGTYLITVHRTTAGAAQYRLHLFCLTAAGTEASNPPGQASLVVNN